MPDVHVSQTPINDLPRGMMTFPKWWSSTSFNQHQGLSLESFWCIWDPPRACWMLNCNSSIFCCAKHIPAWGRKNHKSWDGLAVWFQKAGDNILKTGFFTLNRIIKKKRTSLKSHTPKKVAEHNDYPPKKKKNKNMFASKLLGSKNSLRTPLAGTRCVGGAVSPDGASKASQCLGGSSIFWVLASGLWNL